MEQQRMSRTITATLTNRQMDALLGALSRGIYEIECEIEEGYALGHELRCANRAYSKLLNAWWDMAPPWMSKERG